MGIIIYIVRINFDYHMVWIKFVGTHGDVTILMQKRYKERTIMKLSPIKTKNDYIQAFIDSDVQPIITA